MIDVQVHVYHLVVPCRGEDVGTCSPPKKLHHFAVSIHQLKMTFIWIFLKLQCIGDSIGDTLNRHIELHCLTPAGGCQFRMILHHKIRLKKHVHQMQHVLMYHFWANHIHLPFGYLPLPAGPLRAP